MEEREWRNEINCVKTILTHDYNGISKIGGWGATKMYPQQQLKNLVKYSIYANCILILY